MKSGRLLAMLLMLQSKGRSSAREIAEELEVSQRTVYRDLDALSAAGVPVHAERGVQGGIVLAAGYRKALTQFGEDEIRALFIAGESALADIGLADGRVRALEKLAGALPDAQRRAAHMMRSRIYVDQRRWWQAAQPREHLATLRRAIWEDRRVTLRYRDRARKITERVIDPLGLVAKAGIWYLVSRYKDEMRTFRAERILGVQENADRFIRPPDFDLDAFWRDWTKKFEESVPEYPVLLRVRADQIEDVTSYWESKAVEDAGRSKKHKLVRVIFPGPEAAVHQIVAWGRRVEVVEPKELRQRVITCAREVIAHFVNRSRN
jgi:predicted DNA-binding transcriptional regulator YafY